MKYEQNIFNTNINQEETSIQDNKFGSRSFVNQIEKSEKSDDFTPLV